MNFKDIERFFKKNYKIMIIAALILNLSMRIIEDIVYFLLMSNRSEKFTVSEALDGMKSTEKKVNDMFYEVDASWNKSSKGIYGKKSIEAEGNIVSRKGDVIAGRNVTASGNVNAKKDINASSKICIGKTCIREGDLKKMKSSIVIAGWAGDGSGSTHMLEEGGWHELHGKAKYDAWTNDRWDFAYIYKGWRFELGQDKNGGKKTVYENKKYKVMQCKITANKASSYRLTWIGY